MFNVVESRIISDLFPDIKGTPLRSGRVTHFKKYFFSKTYIFLLPMYLVYQNLYCGTLISPLSIWQLGLKLECINYVEQGKSLFTLFRDQQI